ncbi:MAG: acylphosphatase [Chloroflexi bacterium]|nr:acylphosphatase [Chloroflexota bacterium]
MTPVRMFVKIYGDVQGVGFRAFARDRAQRLGVRGYVRNAWDGTVEVLAEGDRMALETFLDILREGPRSARVSHVEVQWGDATGEFRGFGVRF